MHSRLQTKLWKYQEEEQQNVPTVYSCGQKFTYMDMGIIMDKNVTGKIY